MKKMVTSRVYLQLGLSLLGLALVVGCGGGTVTALGPAQPPPSSSQPVSPLGMRVVSADGSVCPCSMPPPTLDPVSGHLVPSVEKFTATHTGYTGMYTTFHTGAGSAIVTPESGPGPTFTFTIVNSSYLRCHIGSLPSGSIIVQDDHGYQTYITLGFRINDFHCF